MRKRVSVVAVALVSGVLWQAPQAWADEGLIVGTEVGAMIPRGSLSAYTDTGGVISPFVGYMFNDYLGLWAHLEAWGAKSKDRPGHDDNTTWVGALNGGPRFAFPLGSIVLWGTFEPGIVTALADEALTDTSWGFSTGAGLDFKLPPEGLRLGAYGRWNRAYQRVHGTHDALWITAGLNLTYNFVAREAEAQPPPPPPPPPPLALPPPLRQKIVLRGVNFDFDKANIRPDARPVLDEAIRILKEYGDVSIVAEGYTDSIGTEEYNLKLSFRRANAVRDYLVAGGISPSRIAVKGFGEADPVASNETPDGRAQNRRVELRVTGG